ncbi:MAG: SUMF1/EgtB/PvdO family nonheme iron enzyme [Deferrisomatales bacterium]|nr:SUMF1/EgtB/PvdO family nonheme iron enzyme [Deferrisomatales bacterium]
MTRKTLLLAILCLLGFSIGCGGGGGGGDPGPTDTTPPVVVSRTPAPDATAVAVGATITATFSEALDPSTITAATFTLSGPSGEAAGSVIYSGVTATFTPSASLAHSTTYTATVTTGVRDLAGNALTSPVSWTFTTAAAPDTTPPDTTPPAVVSRVPPPGATGVAVDISVTATFSEALDPSTITAATFTLSGPSGAVAGTVHYAGTTATFTPAGDLWPGTAYSATIAAGVRDLAGNPLGADHTWSFTTGTEYSDPLSGMEFVWVPPGTFERGEPYTTERGAPYYPYCTFVDGWPCSREQPSHPVTLTRGFYLAKHEVTQAQWEAVMGSNPSYFQPANGFTACPDCPVDRVSWNDAQEFVALLNAATGKTYRLPTDAEWEWAAKGGPLSQGYKFAGSDDPDEVAWWCDGEDYEVDFWFCVMEYRPSPVGRKLPNELGLYDMSGNVFEWVQDYFDYYPPYPVTDPEVLVPNACSYHPARVIRGGGYMYDWWISYVHPTRRTGGWPDLGRTDVGVRLALSPDGSNGSAPAPDGLAAPTGLTATPGSNHVLLTWNGVPGTGSYRVYWGTHPGVTTGNALGGETAAPVFLHDGLAPGQTYHYRVASVDAEGEGALSQERSALPGLSHADYVEPVTGMELVWVEPGSFEMGDTFGDCATWSWADTCDVEQPVHTVTLTRGFYMGVYEVTQAQWEAVMGSNPSSFQPDRCYPACPTCPVEGVSWDDTQVFLQELNQQTGKNFRLPTEAEWEYAARGGPDSQGFRYAGSDDPYEVAWNWDDSGKRTRRVGQKLPNELGLYDMSGNVWEWVQDWFDYYPPDPVTDPQGPPSPTDPHGWGWGRVTRGGGFDHVAWSSFWKPLRPTYRYYFEEPAGFDPWDQSSEGRDQRGLRLVLPE